MRSLLLLVLMSGTAGNALAQYCVQGTVPAPFQIVTVPFTVWEECCDWQISTCGSGTVDTIIGSVLGPGIELEGSNNPGLCVNPCSPSAQPDLVDADHGTNMLDGGTPPECLPAGEYTLQLAVRWGWDPATCSLLTGPIPWEVCITTCDRSAGTGDLPAALELGEAYPNPFNPVTTLDWSLARTAGARLAVYDLTGREVAVLADGLHAAGAHSSRFDGANLASGVYIATLEAEGRTFSRKLVLLK